MWDHVLKFIHNLQKTNYTGQVKIGVDMGECTSIQKANAFDVHTDTITTEFMPDIYLSEIKKNSNGSICYVLKNGIITEYAFLWTFKSTTLKGLLIKASADADM